MGPPGTHAREGRLAVSGRRAMLYRLRGVRPDVRGHGRGAGRAGGEPRLARSVNAEYEAGQTLVALAGLAQLEGEPKAEEAHRREARVIIDRLGVVRLAEIPLPVPVPPVITELSNLER